MHTPLKILGLLLILCGLAPSALGQKGDKPKGVFLSQQEALDLAFPKATVERSSVYLSKAEQARLDKLAGEKVGRGIIYPYRAYGPPAKPGDKRGPLLGTAWFDKHKVRTMGETVMVVVDPAGKVARIEILAFAEPQKYLPRAKWYAQFYGKTLGKELTLKGDIRGIAGATMSCRSVTNAVRRILAEHRVAEEQAAKEAERKAKKQAEKDKAGKGKSQ